MINSAEIDSLLAQMADAIAADRQRQSGDFRLVGLRTGGVWIAQRLQTLLRLEGPVSELDVSFYRDDYQQRGLHADIQPSQMPLSVDGQQLILVDDILHSGRTIRAALNAVFDLGRPHSVQLAVLIDRGQRQLPIAADFCGRRIEDLASDQMLRLRGPTPLELVVEPGA